MVLHRRRRPGAPAVTAVPSGAGQVTVIVAAADGHGLPITSYRVDDVTHRPVPGGRRRQTSATSSPVCAVGATHDFQVVATNDLGDGPPGIGRRHRHRRARRRRSIATVVPGSASAFVSWTLHPDGSGARHRLPDPARRRRAARRRLRHRRARWPPSMAGHTYAVRVRATNAAGGRRVVRAALGDAHAPPGRALPRPAAARCGRSTPAPGAAPLAPATVAGRAGRGRHRRRPSGRGRRLDEPHRHQRHRAGLLHGVAVRPAPAARRRA